MQHITTLSQTAVYPKTIKKISGWNNFQTPHPSTPVSFSAFSYNMNHLQKLTNINLPRFTVNVNENYQATIDLKFLTYKNQSIRYVPVRTLWGEQANNKCNVMRE